jgi:hypothetical protein
MPRSSGRRLSSICPQWQIDMSVHTCSYYCDRPECIRAQRDELRQKLEQLIQAEREAVAKLVEELDRDNDQYRNDNW